jgi:hypothetical protein
MHMLQVFYLDVAYVCNGFQTKYVLSVSSVFRCMLQMLHLDVLKVDWGVAHIAMSFACYSC